MTVGPSGLLLAHGAGGDRDYRWFVALENELSMPVRRFDFPYRKQKPLPGRRPPDRAPKLLAAIDDELAQWAADGVDAENLVLGGRSMGGRMCSMAVAAGTPARGLVLLSYPLHPPKKPEKLRADHFGEIEVPCLFIMGTKDPFGTPEEFDEHLDLIAGPVTVVWLDGANHSPSEKHDRTALNAIGSWLDQLENS